MLGTMHKFSICKEFPAMTKIMFVCHGSRPETQGYQVVSRHFAAAYGHFNESLLPFYYDCEKAGIREDACLFCRYYSVVKPLGTYAV